MLEQSILEHLGSLFANLKAKYIFDIFVEPSHESRQELLDLLNDVASCSQNIECHVNDGDSLFFNILRDDVHTGITFRAVPTGHEFSSLILAVLNSDGIGKNFPDDYTTNRIKAFSEDITLTSYISLSCTNCPDIVQNLNLFALINKKIKHEIVDGSINQEEVEKANIGAVPTLFANGNLLYVGKSSINELLDKLEEKFAHDTLEKVELREFDMVVVGGGPAGVTAAIYSARKGLRVAIVAERIGGQVNETVAIENLIVVAFTTGKELASDLKTLLVNNNIEIFENRRVEGVSLDSRYKILTLKGGDILRADQVIIATGATWRKLNIDGESEYIGRGVAFCPHCDGPLFKNKKVAVIGGGNSGVEAAIDLAGICSEVILVEFAPELKADKILVDKAMEHINIKIVTNSLTLRFEGDEKRVRRLIRVERTTLKEEFEDVDGIFVQIGLQANSGIFANILDTNKTGEIMISSSCRTSIDGIYAAGDVTDGAYKQIIISMGEGAKAALAAFDDRIRI